MLPTVTATPVVPLLPSSLQVAASSTQGVAIVAMYHPTSPSQHDVDYDHHRRHRLPCSIAGAAGQVPIMVESRIGADEALSVRPASWSTGPMAQRASSVVYRESVVVSDSTDRLVERDGAEGGHRGRKVSELFGLGFGFGVRKRSGAERRKERGVGDLAGEREGQKDHQVKKRKASRRLSEMVGFGGGGGVAVDANGAGGASEKGGWLRRLSSLTWKKAKSPTRKDSVWPTTTFDDEKDKEVDYIVPQNTATEEASTEPYPSQADWYVPWRRSQDSETVSGHWTPTHSAAHSETNLLFNQENDAQELLEYLPQLEQCSTRSQWQEIQRASSNLTLAHKAITPPHTISPAAELTRMHQRAAKFLERVQRAYEEGRFSHDNIAKTFDDDRKSSPEAEAKARDDYLRAVAARDAGMMNSSTFAQTAQRQAKEDEDRDFRCNCYRRRKKSSLPDRSVREASGEEHGRGSVGSEMAQLAGVIGSSMQQAHPFM